MFASLRRQAAACACLSLGACATHSVAPATALLDSAASAASADAAYATGRQYFHAGDLPAALAAYVQALRRDPQHEDARNGLAVLHAQRGDTDAAIALWQALTDGADISRPRQAYLFRNLGHAYALSGRLADALSTLEKACLLDPFNAQAWLHLSTVLQRLGQHERAALTLRQAHSLQQHEARRDYALLRGQAKDDGAEERPAPMARIEITQEEGMARLQRIPGAAKPALALPEATPPLPLPMLRLEILNGNGTAGMAAALGRSLAAGPTHMVRLVRLGNAASFHVAHTRIEYRTEHARAARLLARQLGVHSAVLAADYPGSDLRLTLGRDFADPATLHRYYLQQLQLARRALAALG